MEYRHYIKIAVAAMFAVAFIYFFLRSIAKKNVKESPEHLLEQKFSKGEINAYEYNQRKRQLQREEDLKIKIFFLASM